MPSASQLVTKATEVLGAPRSTVNGMTRNLIDHEAFPKSVGRYPAELTPYHLALFLIGVACAKSAGNTAAAAAEFGGLETPTEDGPVPLVHWLARKIAAYRDAEEAALEHLNGCQLTIYTTQGFAIWSEQRGDDVAQLVFGDGARAIPAPLSFSVTISGATLAEFAVFARTNVYQLQ